MAMVLRLNYVRQILHSLSPLSYSASINRFVATELSAALRPFYFAVHPDLFGQHPHQRQTNEESLKVLSAQLEALYERRYHSLRDAKALTFYVRDENANSRDTFKLIKIQLDQTVRDPKVFIQRLLESCNLSTEYIKSIKSDLAYGNRTTSTGTGSSKQTGFRPGQDYEYGSEFTGFESEFWQAKSEKKIQLDSWIKDNVELANERMKEVADLKAEVEKIQKSVVQQLGLRDARYDCGWNIEHYRGCLRSLERLAEMHAPQMQTLRNRIVVFAPFTGVSLEGHIMLYTGDVLNNWIDFIKNIPQHDAFLKIIPLYEQSLSQVLLGIQIGRRKFMPKQQAKEYASHLMKVTTTLGDYLSKQKYPESWPKTLNDYQIVVESEAGPLMVSPTGQFIAPATCPGSILIDFITTNLATARERMAKYKEEKHIERKLVQECSNYLQIHSLTKEDSMTPEKMINTLQHLLDCDPKPFQNMDLHITNFYSVLLDGTICIPWDFKNKS